MDGMKMVESNGYDSTIEMIPDDINELLIIDNDDDDSENTLEDYGSDIESDREEDESGD